MELSCTAIFRWTVAVISGALLTACESTQFPDTPAAAPPAEALGSQTAELQATSSYNDLRQRTGAAVSLGSTCGAANEVSSTCGNSGAAGDFSFKWMAPYSGNFSFTTHSSTFDTVLQLTPWGSGVSMGCNDNADGTPQSAITMYISSGTTIRITVDGAGGTCGEFQLNITPEMANCGTNFCNSPPSPCHSPAGTCVNGACSYTLLAAGTACDDGNSCTYSDTCNGSGVCTGTAITCNSPPTQCHAAGSCSNGSCVYPYKPSGSACSDGNSCTSGDYCNGAGSCYGGTDDCGCPEGTYLCGSICCPEENACVSGRFCRPYNCMAGEDPSYESCTGIPAQ